MWHVVAATSLLSGVRVSLELQHIQSRLVISNMNSHSCWVRSFYPTQVTSTKVPVVNMVFAKNTKTHASNHIFPTSPFISEALAFSLPQPVCPAVLFPVIEPFWAYSATPSRTAWLVETKNHRRLSPLFCAHLSFLPALLASRIRHSQSEKKLL